MAKTTLGYEIDKYSIAQSFFVKENQGIYLTAVDLLFVSNLEPTTTLPVMMELRPMVNGFPSSNVMIPGSEVTVAAADVKFSTDASVFTRFEFDEPIFLQGARDFAFIVHTNTSKYELFAAVGDTFVIGNNAERISKQQTLGSLFFSQNAATFTPAQELDISFKLIRASFNKSQGDVVLRNCACPVRLLDPNPISVTAGSRRVVVDHPNHGFQPNDKFHILMNGGSVGGLDSSRISGIQKVDSADYGGYSFTIPSIPTSGMSDATGGGAAVTVEKSIPYNRFYPMMQVLAPRSTAVKAGFKGTQSRAYDNAQYGNATASNRYTKLASTSGVIINTTNETDVPFAVLSDRIADSAGISNKTAELTLRLSSFDSSVSPLVDLQRASMILLANSIDKQSSNRTTTDNGETVNVPLLGRFVAETSATGGSAASKHLTNIITLASPAKGLKIILGANRPFGTDFQVFFRTANEDQEITAQTFTLAGEQTNHPIDDNPTTFRDYEYLPGGVVGDLTPFTKFQIKIVMRSLNIAKAPKFSDLRVIALSS